MLVGSDGFVKLAEFGGFNGVLEEVVRYLPAIIPLAVVQLGLMAAALVHAVRHPKYRFGNMVVWIIVIIAVNVIGPIVYFVLGRGEDADADEGEGEDKV